MQHKLLEALKVIRRFYTGVHIHDTVFRLAVADYIATHKDNCPVGFADIHDASGKRLAMTKFQKVAMNKWGRERHAEQKRALNHSPQKLNEFAKYYPLMEQATVACEESLEILIRGADLPKTIEDTDLIRACEELQSLQHVDEYEARFSKRIDRAIRFLELKSLADSKPSQHDPALTTNSRSAATSPTNAKAPTAFIPTDTQLTILDELEGCALSVPQIAKRANLKLGTVKDNIKKLKNAGLIVFKIGVGYYRPDKPPKIDE